MQATDTPDKRPICRWLFLAFFSLYLLCAGDHFTEMFYASDEVLMIRTMVSLVEEGRLTFTPTYEQTAAKFGILQSVVAVPFYLAGKAASALARSPRADLIRTFFIYFTNAFLTALLVALFYRFSRYLRYPRGVALASAAALGLTTILFPYAKYFFSEPLVALTLLAAVYQLARYARCGRLRSLLASSLCLGLAALARADSLVLLPVFVLAILRAGGQTGSRTETRSPAARLWGALRALGLFALPLAAAAAVMLLVNALRYGSPWRSGYGQEAFSTPLLAGLYGLLFSPGRGLIIYNPALLIVPFVFARFARRRPLLAGVILMCLALKLFFYARWWSWQGGWSWGSRFMLPLVPLLFLMVNEALLRWRRLAPGPRALILALFAAGFYVQLLGVLANPSKHGNDIWAMTGMDENPFLFIPQLSFLAGNVGLIASGQIDSFIRRFPEHFGAPALAAVLVPLILVFLIAFRQLMRAGNLHPRAWLATHPLKMDTWRARGALALVLFNAAVFLVCFIARESNKIPRLRLAPEGAQDEILDVAMDRTVMMEAHQPEPAGPREPSTYRWRGWIMMPLTGDYIFHVKVSGFFSLRIGEREVLANRQETQQFVPAAKAHFDKGLYPFALEYRPVAPDYRLIRAYWTVPGFGLYRAPLSSAWIFADRPSPFKQALFALDRFKLLIVILSLMAAWAAGKEQLQITNSKF